MQVNHTYSEDGSIRYGDNIMLQHDGSGHFLACDPYEDFMPGAYKYYVSCASSPTAVARNTFRVVRPPRGLESLDADPDDDVLRIGQGFSLMCNEKLLIQPDSKLLSPPLYLSSAKKNERNATKTTNRQLVYLSPSHDADAVWFVNKPSQGRANASDRFLSNGDAVNAQETLLLTHRQTNCCLVCDTKQRDHTDFGVELECYADRTNAFGKLGLVVSEFKGVSTAYTLSKPDAPHYFWHIVTASAPQAVPESTFGERGDLSIPTDRDILREFQALVRAKVSQLTSYMYICIYSHL